MLTSDTQAITIAAPPEVVLDYVGDARNLPDWAPAFAQGVQPDGEHWIVDSGDAQLRIDVRVVREVGTVDFLRPGTEPGIDIGAFARVVRNGEGSDFMFTRFFEPGTSAAQIADAQAVVAGELEAVKARCEAARGG